ncbi:MAG: 6-bladed beta-propeller [Gemmatimonadetes bacterium]|uniref:6-bladed beta-propeller n=1 Tax=Candidatus Kutchimonas denitrificans TaxID=3056748 RepID=A0AAE4Z7C3_9BACT|nr:6-bladed beta-propeller [Gemmatimonadota bacterium]NIR74052.1 6-bladed beta-propeller [Candidatus Kutchimonas denitrificans]NIS01614.1 6-bladed beta-propeller [Gemmatimonadota bacterium]NIT67352.1 6-bladed beta-propeller [Gemmatimonadota bacterium]NIU52715.1 6-bladed beta-propeller [Gemmatimonadota bacterium]
MYVSDAARSRLVVFDTTGERVAEWGRDRLGIRRPMHISFAADSLLYVADFSGDRVVALDTAGRIVRVVGGRSGSGVGELDAPGGAALLGDTLFVADFYNHRVQSFGPARRESVGTPGRVLPGRLHYPTDVAVSDSLVYVGDAYNHRIQVFRSDGAHLESWGGPLGIGLPGPFKGWFRVATGVEVADGKVYVADFYNDRIQIFSEAGGFLGQVDTLLNRPTDSAVAPDGTLYVADYGNRRIVRFRPE